MNLRCWMIVGGNDVAWGLPPEMALPPAGAFLPPASNVHPGAWLVWSPTPVVHLTVVCAEIPIVP